MSLNRFSWLSLSNSKTRWLMLKYLMILIRIAFKIKIINRKLILDRTKILDRTLFRIKTIVKFSWVFLMWTKLWTRVMLRTWIKKRHFYKWGFKNKTWIILDSRLTSLIRTVPTKYRLIHKKHRALFNKSLNLVPKIYRSSHRTCRMSHKVYRLAKVFQTK